jgi:uncharacterized protein YkwD
MRFRGATQEIFVAEVGEAAHRRQRERGRAEPYDAPAFLIDGHEQRHVARCGFTNLCRERRDVREPGLDVALEENDAAACSGGKRATLGRGERCPLEADHEELPSFSAHSAMVYQIAMSNRSVLLVLVVSGLSACGPGFQSRGPSPTTTASSSSDNTSAPPVPRAAAQVPHVERPQKKLTIPEARRYMLELVNRDRATQGLGPVELDDGAPTIAGQAHAEDMVRLGYLGHWGSDGSVPEQRHTEAGGIDMVLENALCFTDEKTRTLDPGPRIDPEQIEKAESKFFDEQPPNDGHRKNILKPMHTRVGIGAAQSKSTATELAVPCFSQEFVDGYGNYATVPKHAKVGATLHVEGTLSGAKPTGVGLARVAAPKPMQASELNKLRSYPVPKPYQMYWGQGFVTPIPLKVDGGKFSIDIPLDDKKQPGLYEVSVWAKIGDGTEHSMVSLRTIVVD